MGCVDKGLADKWGRRLFKGSNKCTTQLKQASNKIKHSTVMRY
jgi:hypothetical protein